MSYKVFFAFSLEEAKELCPEPGNFVIIGKASPKRIKDWKSCEGSSIPEELKKFFIQNLVLIKVCEQKIKMFKFPEMKSLCCEPLYHEALKQLV